MATIYDKKQKNRELEKVLAGVETPTVARSGKRGVLDKPAAVKVPATTAGTDANRREMEAFANRARQALTMVDDIVTKDFVTRLSDMQIVPVDEAEIGRNTILYKVNKMVYEKDEYATEKFVNALGVMNYAECSVFLIVDGHRDRTDFYIGIRNNDARRTDYSVAQTFESSMTGQFPGMDLKKCSLADPPGSLSVQERLFDRLNEASAVCSCSGVPAYKVEDGKYNNQTFVQGIEKLALAMQGREYTAVVLATNVSGASLSSVRRGYEQLYTQMSAVSTQQVSYATNESLANAVTRTKGVSVARTESTTVGTSHTKSKQHSVTKGESWSHTDNSSESKQNAAGKVGAMGAAATSAGVALAATGVGAPLGLAVMAVGGVASIVGALFGKTETEGSSDTRGGSRQETEGTGTSDTTTQSKSNGTTNTDSYTDSEGNTVTVGSSKNFTVTVHNKHVQEILKRIDTQLDRLAVAEGTGVWASGAYFMSYENDRGAAETGAAIFKSLMQGEKSGVETSAVNMWLDNVKPKDVRLLTTAITSFVHPTFMYAKPDIAQQVPVNSSSLISTAELAMQMGLPRKSVPGFPVLEHISLGKEVVTQNGKTVKRALNMGCIFDQGKVWKNNAVGLDPGSLTQHVFVTGSTGCGKSETVYRLVTEAKKARAKFLIVEPAKGEYKNVFGNANVYGTNPELTELLRINPFSFPAGVHVLEHIDRLTEIFNVCWPMYAAMPAVLKKAMIQAYEKAGWSLLKNRNRYGRLFPTFGDLLCELEEVIKHSAYSEEVKGNYIGSLVTRVESLTNGLYGAIFSADELPEVKLFDEDTVVDLSRMASQESKALIMGVLIMKLNEYRMVTATAGNAPLKHITVLEEAHNILKRTGTEQTMESSNVAGKAVEMIANSIAEMRTYGESFVIVDQSPTSIDPAAIKNTNTKFIMRLPDGDDRRIAGKSAGMNDAQLDEIAKLPTGVAVVYQNDWEEPVLCKISRREEGAVKYTHTPAELEEPAADYLADLIKFLMAGRIAGQLDYDLDKVRTAARSPRLTTSRKIQISNLIDEYADRQKLELWNNENFAELSSLVADLLGLRDTVRAIARSAKTFDELDAGLSAEIKDRVAQLPDHVNLCVRQSLMKDFSLGGETDGMIYQSWYRHIINQRKSV